MSKNPLLPPHYAINAAQRPADGTPARPTMRSLIHAALPGPDEPPMRPGDIQRRLHEPMPNFHAVLRMMKREGWVDASGCRGAPLYRQLTPEALAARVADGQARLREHQKTMGARAKRAGRAPTCDPRPGREQLVKPAAPVRPELRRRHAPSEDRGFDRVRPVRAPQAEGELLLHPDCKITRAEPKADYRWQPEVRTSVFGSMRPGEYLPSESPIQAVMAARGR